MSFLSGFTQGAQNGLSLGAGVQDWRQARAAQNGQAAPAMGGLYGLYRDARALQQSRAAPSVTPTGGAAQAQPNFAPMQPDSQAAAGAGMQAQAAPSRLPASEMSLKSGNSPFSASLGKFSSIIAARGQGNG